jgi:hypothetical protein
MTTEVQTQVEAERGRWVVYLVVLSDSGVERRRLESYPTQERARLAASQVQRSVARRRPPRRDGDD